jgi:hypothetical protein
MTKITEMVAHTHQTYEDFCRNATFYAICKVSDLTLFATPDKCGEDMLALQGVSFPVTLFG